ncbi:MAG: hypothetical protein QXI33_02810 [Candidatus Pacearchaeota archaeon]
MGFFNKKKESEKESRTATESGEFDESLEIPLLPELPNLPELPDSKEESLYPDRKNNLPVFPPSKIGDRFNQNTIKEAVMDNSQKIEFIPSFPNQMRRYSKEDETEMRMSLQKSGKEQFDKKINKQRTMEFQDYSIQTNAMTNQYQLPNIAGPKRPEPLFIRLDTFENALASFDEIKLRIHEIESLLRDIKEIKIKEEKELNEWEREVETIKARLGQIDKEIFENMR